MMDASVKGEIMARRTENMARISEYDLYDIENLFTYWNSGWHHLAHVGERQCPHKLAGFGDKSRSPLERVRSAIDEVFPPCSVLGKNLKVPDSIPAYDAVLNLAASSNKEPYGPAKFMYSASSRFGLLGSVIRSVRLGPWAEDEKEWQKTIENILKALATSSTYGEAFTKIATNEKNLARFMEYWSAQPVLWSKGEYLEASIGPRLREMAKWLQRGLRGKEACEEAWWNCLWLYMQPTVETMLGIREKISADMVLYREEIDTVESYIAHGLLRLGMIPDGDKFKVRMVLSPYLRQVTDGSPFTVMSTALLVPPAFDLAQKFQNTFPESRFLQQCHAPSCRKHFYTQRKNQVVCGGSRGHEKTKCALEWKSFRAWLKALGKDPDRDWYNPKQKEAFRTREH